MICIDELKGGWYITKGGTSTGSTTGPRWLKDLKQQREDSKTENNRGVNSLGVEEKQVRATYP